MSEAMRQYLTNPATGKPYSRAERLALLDTRFADQTIRTEVPSGTLAERQDARHKTSLLQQEIAQQLSQDQAANQPKANPYASRIAALVAELEWAIPSAKNGLELRLSALRKAAAEYEADKATAERRATFEASPDAQRVSTHYDAFMKSRELVHPDLTEADILMLRAIASSDAYATPADQASAYFAQVSKCEALQCQREAERLGAAEQAAVKASTDFAAQKARTDAANARLAELGGSDAD